VTDPVTAHYGDDAGLAERVAERLRAAGKELDSLTTRDLAAVDEFHTRGRAATLELSARMGLGPGTRVLDIGSGLGGPARAVAETYDCDVTGLDLNAGFCRAAAEFTAWVGLQDKVAFRCGDATQLPFDTGTFDAAMTLHAAMNIPAKDAVYAEARRVLKPGGVFAIYDVLQGEGGPALFPVPWARQPSASHLSRRRRKCGNCWPRLASRSRMKPIRRKRACSGSRRRWREWVRLERQRYRFRRCSATISC